MDSMIFGKVPPQAKELEEAVLGAILLHKDTYDIVAEILKPDCFYSEANQRIYRAMATLSGKNSPIDLLTVVEQLKQSEELDLVGGPFYVSKLTNAVVSNANVESHSKIVFQKFIQRELIRISGEILSDAYEDSTDAFDLLDDAERKISDVGLKNLDGGMVSIETVMMSAVKKIEEWRQIDDSVTGIPSGFDGLDKATRGWQPGDLIILAARPSVGKTAFALNIVKHAASNTKKPVTVAAWSLEMKAVFLALRMISAESEKYLYKLQTGRISDEEMKELMKTIHSLSKLNIFFDENTNINLQSLARKARRLKKKNKLGLIVIDYLQLMTGEEKSGNREQEVSKISRGLKNLAQELEVPIIALSQLSREMGSKNVNWNYGPPISAIRESGGIEQDADVIMMLWGPTDDEIAKDPSLEGRRKVRIAKQRNGVLITEELNFKNEIQLFEAIGDGFNNTPTIPGLIPMKEAVKKFYETDKDDDLPF